MDCCKYVNVFHGCGEIDLPEPRGIASKWFFIKAGCGNTSPAACVPFGAMSVSPYSGGYPTGYGNHRFNSHSRPPRFEEGKGLSGFAHLQQSGTGAIGYYYNYAVVSPLMPGSPERTAPQDETAVPGYYSCRLGGILCELTADERTAKHRYTFPGDGGRTVIDFTNNGLRIPGEERKTVKNLSVKCGDGVITAGAEIEGVKIYFAVRHGGKARVSEGKAVITDFGRSCELSVAVSLISCEKALGFITSKTFDETREDAYDKWNRVIGKIEIETGDESIKRIFYSNLYHSFVKPCDFTGESFIYPGGGAFCTDFATLWDMYKTALPLIFMTERDMGEKICETLMSTCEALGEMPNSIGLCTDFISHSAQARMLGSYALMTAYRYGVRLDADRMLDVIALDAFSEGKRDFTSGQLCRSHTFLLDMADACGNAADIALERGRKDIYEKLAPLSGRWIEAFSAETGLLRGDSEYYEGTLYNYSFRQMREMKKRIDLAGGNERFTQLLDRFFGYGAPAAVQPTDPDDYAPVEKGMLLGRFEGFNNESDIEAPFSYIFAGRHDRTCEVIRGGMKYMFTEGRGALPGNNDTGALSSYYVFAALGIYPEAGQDLFLIGSPLVDRAVIHLFNGNTLTVNVKNNSDENIYVKSVSLRGRELDSFKLGASELMNGGELSMEMDSRPQLIADK